MIENYCSFEFNLMKEIFLNLMKNWVYYYKSIKVRPFSIIEVPPLQQGFEAEGGYGLEESITLSKAYKEEGVDIFDISSGGEGLILFDGRPGNHVEYQVPMAIEI